MRRLIAFAVLSLTLLTACGPTVTAGEVTDMRYKPDTSGYRLEHTPECGLAVDGTMDCGQMKAKMVYRSDPEDWSIQITACRITGSSAKRECHSRWVSVDRETYESLELGDHYEVASR